MCNFESAYQLYKIYINKEEQILEYIDVLNENGVKTGEILTRKEVHVNGLWHRAIVVAILNENNELLLQQRSANKDKNANLWDISVAGHVSAGQDSMSAAIREIYEEVQIEVKEDISITDFRYMFSYRTSQKFAEDFIENQFYDFFILRTKGIGIERIHMQESEVQNVKFVSLVELEQILKSNKIVKREPVYNVLCDYLKHY